MNGRNTIATTVLLAALSVPALAGCGPSEQEQRNTAAAERSAALAVRERAHDAYSKCVAGGSHPYACEAGTAKGQDEAAWRAMYPGSCAESIVYPNAVRDPKLVQACADTLRVTPAATAPPSASVTAAPMQVGESSPAPWLIGGGLLVVLAGGAVFGGRALLRRFPAPAHGRYSAAMQQPTPQLSEQPTQPADHNPWA